MPLTAPVSSVRGLLAQGEGSGWGEGGQSCGDVVGRVVFVGVCACGASGVSGVTGVYVRSRERSCGVMVRLLTLWSFCVMGLTVRGQPDRQEQLSALTQPILKEDNRPSSRCSNRHGVLRTAGSFATRSHQTMHKKTTSDFLSSISGVKFTERVFLTKLRPTMDRVVLVPLLFSFWPHSRWTEASLEEPVAREPFRPSSTQRLRTNSYQPVAGVHS